MTLSPGSPLIRSSIVAIALAGAAGALSGLAGCGSGDGGGEGTTATVSAAEQGAAGQAAREKALAAKVRELIPVARQPQTGKSRKEQLRIANAEGQLWVIAGKDLDAVRPLLRALKERDYALIADLSGFYVALGKPGSQQILADAVGELYPGDPSYASLPFDFLGAGNAKLTRLVTEELASLGYTVSGQPGPTGLQWGQSGAYGEPPLAPGVPAPPTAQPPSP